MHNFFSNRIGEVPPLNAIGQEMERLEAKGEVILNLSDSNPVRQGLAPTGLQKLLANAGSHIYDPDPRGLLASREALAADLQCHPSRIFLTASTSEAYSWCFKLFCSPGDSVIVPRPGYPLFEWLGRLEGVDVHYYQLEYFHPVGWRIDLDSIQDLVRQHSPRFIVAINPNNPTGSYLSRDERAALREICSAAGIALVCDEVFRHFWLDDESQRESMASDDCLTLVLDGLSKSLCLPQMKVGWIQIGGQPDEVSAVNDGLEIIADSFLSVSAPVMHALPDFLGLRPGVVANVRRRLLLNLAELRRQVGEGYTRVLCCEGGWTALLECPRVMEDDELILALLREEGVFVQPGYFYDFDKRGYLAISLIVNPDDFAGGVTRILALLHRKVELL